MRFWARAFAIMLVLSPVPSADAAPTPLHWKREAHPLIVTVYDQTADGLWSNAIHKLISEWNAGTEGIEFVLSLAAADCVTGHGPFTLVVCVRENSKPNHIGEAYLYTDGRHITHATIWMDPRPNPPRNHLACHELGHALGVVHRGRDANRTSCMTSGYSTKVEHPDKKDFDGVSLAYSHQH